MHFNEQAIRADGHRRARERQNLVAFARAMTRVDQDGQVTAFFDSRDDCQVQGVAGKVREGSNASLAQHHVVVALGKDVFPGH